MKIIIKFMNNTGKIILFENNRLFVFKVNTEIYESGYYKQSKRNQKSVPC